MYLPPTPTPTSNIYTYTSSTLHLHLYPHLYLTYTWHTLKSCGLTQALRAPMRLRQRLSWFQTWSAETLTAAAGLGATAKKSVPPLEVGLMDLAHSATSHNRHTRADRNCQGSNPYKSCRPVDYCCRCSSRAAKWLIRRAPEP